MQRVFCPLFFRYNGGRFSIHIRRDNRKKSFKFFAMITNFFQIKNGFITDYFTRKEEAQGIGKMTYS